MSGVSDTMLRLAGPALLQEVTRPWAPPRGSRLVVAVSGGADSLGMLHLLAALAPGRGWKLVVATLDHGARGSAAQDDAAFVGDIARSLNLPCLRGQASLPGGAGESALRLARRAFLERALALTGAAAIALGHTMDDQVETVLHRLTRGTARRGLSGMSRHDPPYWRPLLDVRRSQLRSILEGAGLAWREDETNLAPTATRNRIRALVIPAIERALGPSAVPAIARAAAILRSEDERLERDAEAAWTSVVVFLADDRLQFRISALRGLDAALGRRLLLRALRALIGEGREITSTHVDDIAALAAARGPGRFVDLPGGFRAVRRRGVLEIARPGIPARGEP